MRMWTALWLLVVVVVGTFAAVNWQGLSALTTIEFVFTQVTAPLGLVMLGTVVGLLVLFLLFLVWLETRALLDLGRARRQEAPGHRAAELRADLERLFSGFRTENQDSMRTVIGRLDDLERLVKDEVDRVDRALSSGVQRAS